jgi:hypothetical protein
VLLDLAAMAPICFSRSSSSTTVPANSNTPANATTLSGGQELFRAAAYDYLLDEAGIIKYDAMNVIISKDRRQCSWCKKCFANEAM